VETALDIGYTHIDTAEMYANQREIGNVLRRKNLHSESGRETIFLTSKIWQDNLQHDAVIHQCEKALSELQTEYIDLLLIHWPNDSVPLEETLGAFSELTEQGKIRCIGVSNFVRSRVKEAVEASPIPIATNQVECHPYLNQNTLLTYCTDLGVLITAYAPLGRGKPFRNASVQAIAENHNVHPAQVILRWQIQRGVIVIPKASSREHLETNMAIFDWELTEDEMERMTSIENTHRERIIDADFPDFNEE
jgi:diketogulonate reductase-like aldo/keto reductase